MEILVVTLLAALAFSPLLLAYHRQKHGRSPKLAMAVNIVAVFALCLLTTGMGIGGHALAAGTEAAASAASSTGWGYLAMALATGLGWTVIVLFQICQVIFTGCLRGAGDVVYTMVSSCICVTFIRTIVSYVCCYVLDLGIYGIWMGIIADQFFRLVFSSLRFVSGKWTKIKI